MKNAFTEEALLQGTKLRGCLDRYFGGEVAGLAAIREMAQNGRIQRVVLAGMGSSYYSAFSVTAYLTGKGIPAVALNAFDAARYQWDLVDDKTLVIGISQSGKSWELADFFKALAGRATIVGICNKEESLLNQNSDIKLPMFADAEVFFANRSFMHSLAILNIVAHTIAGDDIAALKAELYAFVDWLERLIQNRDEMIAPLAAMVKGSDMFDMLADGPSMAAAMQGGIILREGPAARSATIMLADYAHDWILSVNPAYTEFLCVPEFTEEVEVRMYRRIMEKGGRAIVITENENVEPNDKTAVFVHPKCRESLACLYQIAVINFTMASMLGEGWHR